MDDEKIYDILILEDDIALCELLARRLKGVTIHCRTASTVIEADTKFHEAIPDVLVLDYRLATGSTGLDFYRRLVKDGFRVPAILITGFHDESVLTEAMRLGIRDFLPKNDSFLENLPLAVQRLIEDITRERRLKEMERQQLSHDATLKSLEAAGLATFVWDPETGAVEVSTEAQALLKIPTTEIKNIEAFLPFIHADQREDFLAGLEATRSTGKATELNLHCLTAEGEDIWVRIKGRFDKYERGKSSRFLGILWDESEKYLRGKQLEHSNAENQKLAERLQLSMLEIHHRVKNSFQIVNSLLNMELRRKAQLERSDIQRVVSYVQGLAVIHDMLTNRAKLTPGESNLDAGTLIESIASSLGNGGETIQMSGTDNNLPVSPRVASSLSVVATELMINALKHGKPGTLELKLSALENQTNRAALSISNECDEEKPSPVQSSTSTGSPMMAFLAKSDFGSEVVHQIRGGRYEACVEFPLLRESL